MDNDTPAASAASGLDSQASPAHAAPMDLAAPRRLAGRLIMDFYLEEGGGLTPEVKVAPLGRITPALVDRYLPLIYRAIQLAQVEERKAGLPPDPASRKRKAA